MSLNWWSAIRGETPCCRMATRMIVWMRASYPTFSKVIRPSLYEQAQCSSPWIPRAADLEGTGAELSDHDERPDSRHEPDQSHLSQLGHSLQRQAGLWIAASGRVAWEDPGTRGAPPGGVVLPTAGCAENLAPGSTERSARREQEAQDLETAVCDSVDWSDSGGGTVGHFADPTPVSHQATAVDLLWSRGGDQQQCRSRGGRRPAPTEEEAKGNSG